MSSMLLKHLVYRFEGIYVGMLIQHYLLFYYLFSVYCVPTYCLTLLFSIDIMLSTHTMVLSATELIWCKTFYTGPQKRAGLRFFNCKNSTNILLPSRWNYFWGRFSRRAPELFWSCKLSEFSWLHPSHPNHFTAKSILTWFLLSVTRALYVNTSQSSSERWNALARHHMCRWEHAGQLFSGLLRPQS